MTETVEKAAQEVQEKINALKADVEKKIDASEVKTQVEASKTELSAKIGSLETEIVSLREQLKSEKSETKGDVFAEIRKYFLSDERKQTREEALGKRKEYGRAFEIKMDTSDIIPNVVGGFSPLLGNFVDTQIHNIPKRKTFMLGLISVERQIGVSRIWYSERVNETGNAQWIAEGSQKPLIEAQWETADAPTQELAEYWTVSNTMAEVAPAVLADFQNHADELINVQLDEDLFNGTGVGTEISGIITLASPFVVPPALAGYYLNPNIWDVIHAVAVSIDLANFNGNKTIVLNTTWSAAMKGIKGTDEHYVVPPFVTPDGKTISGMRVEFNNIVPAGNILLGELDRFKLVIASNLKYDEALNGEDFRFNRTSFRISGRFGTYLPASYDGSIIYDSIATIQAAIATP